MRNWLDGRVGVVILLRSGDTQLKIEALLDSAEVSCERNPPFSPFDLLDPPERLTLTGLVVAGQFTMTEEEKDASGADGNDQPELERIPDRLALPVGETE